MIIDGDQDLIGGTHRHQDIVRRILERVWDKQVEEKRRTDRERRREDQERRQLELALESVHLDENENERKDEI